MDVKKLLADPLPARAQDRPKQARALSWAPESNGLPFQPHVTQVYFRGLFSPVPRVLVHGPYQETDVVEAHMLDEEGQVVEKALDGTVVRLHKRWENKQFDGRVATFSRLKVLYGERGKRYRLQVTWYERSAGPGLRFSPVCSVVSERAFTVRAHIKKDQFSARSADGGAASALAFPGGSEGAGGELEGEGEGEAEPPDDDDGPSPLPLPLPPPPQQQPQQQPQPQTTTAGRSQKRRRQSAPIAPRSVPPSMVSVMSYEPTDPALAPPQAPRLAPPPPPLPPAPTLHQLFPHHQPQSQAQHPLQPGQPQAPPAHMQHLMNAEPSGGIAYHFSPATVASSSPRTPFIVHAFPSYTHLPYQPQAAPPPLSFEKTDGSMA